MNQLWYIVYYCDRNMKLHLNLEKFKMKIILTGLVLLPGMLFSEIFYVSITNGADTQPGSQQLPWKSLSHAATNVKEGDTVIVLPGTYEESVTVSVSGSEKEPITFRGEPARQAKVRSFELKGDYITIDSFDISNDVPQPTGFGISAGQAHLKTARTGCRMLNNLIHDIVGTAIYSGENALVKGNLMKNVGRGVFANSGTMVGCDFNIKMLCTCAIAIVSYRLFFTTADSSDHTDPRRIYVWVFYAEESLRPINR